LPGDRAGSHREEKFLTALYGFISTDIVEWTRKSPFGYATQVYRVLQAAL
jgi:hypothetical protein